MTLSAADAAHLIRRTGFGVTPAWLADVRSQRNRAAAVDRMLDTSRSPTDSLASVLGILPSETPSNMALLAQWWLDRMATTPTPLLEKLTLFWHGHFVSSPDKVPTLRMLIEQNRLLRRQALGSFHDLAQAVSVDPAMLLYLDNASNVAADPQENFGRELLEVFTLGVGQRSEADVAGMTRAWTGHGLSQDGSRYQFHPDRHDHGPKVLFGLPPRRWDGPAALRELLLGARAGESSRYIAAKLFSFLAYPVGIEDPVVEPLAARFRDSGLSIAALTRAILVSEEFWSPAARGALVRSPAEWVVAALQAVGEGAIPTRAEQFMPQMGQQLFYPPSVAGWGQNGYWVSTAGAWGKAAWAVELRKVANRSRVLADVVDLSPAQVASRGFEHFGIVAPDPGTRSVVERWVERTRAEGHGALVPQHLVHLMLLSPDFQLA